ncbi:hypothetical protein [Paenibacillus tarimensis]|uniref:hypothetical protein n=1 Tax=Paenibacillus tarimensis TaxID=416012 RepID=UPI001F3ADEDC|nr:hypothetical protein [Paenibacillus tarimensis]MCF2945888.1 hypothetical protein [Paenibacillus tarimensis]
MSSYKLLSFDIWDTILRRNCHPDEVKLHVARTIFLNYYDFLLPEYRDYYNIYFERCKIEGQIGEKCRLNGHDDEYLHVEVIEQLLDKISGGSIPAAQKAAVSLTNVELEQEKAVIYLDGQIENKINSIKAENRVFISDFYSDRAFIESLLKHAGYRVKYDKGYVSSEYKINKRSGKLFKHVHADLKINPSEHVHIGDSVAADVDAPKRLGIETIHYYNDQEENKRTVKQQKFDKRMQSRQFTVDLAPVQHKYADSNQQALYEAGKKYSVVFYTYVMEIIEKAKQRGFSTVYYFTREGEFFKKIHDDILASHAYGCEMPKAELLEVSRIATFSSSLRSVTLEELMRLWNQYSTQSMKALFKSLDIGLEEYLPYLSKYGIEYEKEIQYPWLDARVQQLFSDQQFVLKLQKEIDNKRAKFLGYLANKGISQREESIFIVDIGWRGTIQDNLAYLLEETRVEGYYLGLFDFINEQPVNTIKYSFLDKTTMGRVLRFVSPIEMMCNSASGSVVHYDENGSAVKKNDPNEDDVHAKYIAQFQEGVLSGTREINPLIRQHALVSQDLKRQAISSLSDLMLNPPKVLAAAYFELAHNETFGLGQYVYKKPKFPYATAALGLVSRKHRRAFKQQLEDSSWPQGLLVYYNMHSLNRYYNNHMDRILSTPSASHSVEDSALLEELEGQRRLLEERYAAMMEMEQMIIERDNTIQGLEALLKQRDDRIRELENLMQDQQSGSKV